MPTSKLNRKVMEAAIEGFESQKRGIDNQIAELRAMLSGGPAETVATPEAPARKRRRVGAAARKRMAEGQKARWAKLRGESEKPGPVPVAAPKAKRKMSAAGRAAIIAATKKMWARRRAAAKAAAKKTGPRKKSAVKKAAATAIAPATE